MSIRNRITTECPEIVPHLLDKEFDTALLGWVRNAYLKPTPAYHLNPFLTLAVGMWDDERAAEFVVRQTAATEPQVVFVDDLPANSTGFWGLVTCGMLVWDQLNAAVVGIAEAGGTTRAVYDAASALAELRAAMEDSTNDDGMQLFFEHDIRDARLGMRTPLMLYTDRSYPTNNRLGTRRGQTLPVAPLPAVSK